MFLATVLLTMAKELASGAKRYHETHGYFLSPSANGSLLVWAGFELIIFLHFGSRDMFLTTVLLMMAMELARRAKRYHQSHLSQCQWFPPRASRIRTLYLVITWRVFYHCATAADQEKETKKYFFPNQSIWIMQIRKCQTQKNNKKRHLKPKEILPSF